jgi:ABC-type multidrug transport system ATPase subunit
VTTDVWLMPGAPRRARGERARWRVMYGLETAVGHRGTRLSGGERQRVAIGRALLRRPRLLLLDEATSQLDALNEAALRETVAETALMTTVLVVAHRLSTVTMADRIIVVDAGQVKAAGTHAELVASDPLYAELAATQFPGQRGRLTAPSGPPEPHQHDAGRQAGQPQPWQTGSGREVQRRVTGILGRVSATRGRPAHGRSSTGLSRARG